MMPQAAIGAAKVVGSAVGQVGIQLALEKAFFNKDVQETTKKTESAFSNSFGKIEKTTKSAFSNMGNTISNRLSKVRDNFAQSFNKIKMIVQGAMLVASGFMVKFAKDGIQAASDTQAAWTGLFSIVNGTGKSFVEAKKFIQEYTSDGLIPLTDAVTAYKTLAARGYETKQIEEMMLALKDAAAFGRQSAYSYGEAIKSAAEGLKNENSILVDNAGVTKNVAKMWDEYAASIGTTANNLTLAQKRQAEYQGILEETKFQQGDAAKYADTYAGKLAKLNTAFFNLKVTVGQVLTPIIELFLPVITKAINGLTTLFNKLKSIMSVFGLEMKEYIGGETSSAISSATDSTSGLTSGLDSAGNAAAATAKKIKKAFAGVDEINVLNTSNNASSGGTGGSSGGVGGTSGGSTGGTTTGGFEDTKETVTQNLDWLERSAYDWGVAFGKAINNGLGLIPWDAIQTTVVGAVTKVAEFLNGAVEGLSWYRLGNTLGEGFNTVIYGLNTFFETFDWANLGEKLGYGLNGLINAVDWDALGEYFSLKFNALFDVVGNFLGTTDFGFLGKELVSGINNAIEKADFDSVGETIENGLNGAIDFLWSAFDEFDAETAGQQIANLINNIKTAIQNTDWGKLGEALSEGASKLMKTVKTAVKETDWGELVGSVIDAIVDFVSNIDWFGLGIDWLSTSWEIGKALVEGILVGIGKAVVGIGEILYNILVKPIVDGVKSLFGINSPSTVFAEIGGFLIEGLWAGIEGMKDWFVGKWKTVQGWFSDITVKIKGVFDTTKEWVNEKKEQVKDWWGDVKTSVKSKYETTKENVQGWWSDTKAWFSSTTDKAKTKVASIYSTTKSTVKGWWSNVKTWWNDKKNGGEKKTKVGSTNTTTKKQTSGWWTTIKGWWSSKKLSIGSSNSTTKSQVSGWWSSIKSWWGSKKLDIKANVSEATGSVKGFANDVISKINSKLPSWLPKIPKLAQGGWLKANNPQLAIVGDNKHEPEIVAPESKIREQVSKALEETGTNTTQQIEFVINVKYEDGKSIIKKINNTQIKDGKISLLV